jgi:hypothetical protein
MDNDISPMAALTAGAGIAGYQAPAVFNLDDVVRHGFGHHFFLPHFR